MSVADATIDGWTRQSDRLPVVRSMTSFTLEIAGLTLFGSRIGGEDKLRDAFEQWTADIDRHFRNPLSLPRSLPTPWNRRTQRAVSTIAEHLDACVAARKLAPQGERTDALGLLLSAQADERMLDPAVIRGAVLTLYLAGHDTTATALAWCLYLLGQNPDALVRLRAEADEVLGDARPTYDDVKRLPVALGVYKEALRLYPPTFAMVRESHRSVEIGGHTIRAGDSAATSSGAATVAHRARERRPVREQRPVAQRSAACPVDCRDIASPVCANHRPAADPAGLSRAVEPDVVEIVQIVESS